VGLLAVQEEVVMTTKTEDEVRKALEKALGKHTKDDDTFPDVSMGVLMGDPDLVAAVKDMDQFIDETHKETIENWKKRAQEDSK
jgi:hypothetical protein